MQDYENLAHELIEVIPLVMREMRAQMRLSRGGDVSVMQFRALAHLKANPGAPLAELAEHLGLTPSSTSSLVEGLVEKGLVERRDSPADRRRLSLNLTPPGEEVLHAAVTGARRHVAARLAACSPSEAETLLSAAGILRRIYAPGAPQGDPQTAPSMKGREPHGTR